MQKVVVARELSSNPKLLIAAQPTRGVDIGATEFIHQRLLEQRENGMAILLISEDLDEILELVRSDCGDVRRPHRRHRQARRSHTGRDRLVDGGCDQRASVGAILFR